MIAVQEQESAVGFATSGCAYLAQVVFTEPLTIDDYWVILDGLSHAMVPTISFNMLADPLTDDPHSPPRGLLIIPMDGDDPAAIEREIREAAGSLPIHRVRLTQIRTKASQ